MTCKRMCSARNLQLVTQTSAFAKKSFVFGQNRCWYQRLYGCCVPKVCGGVPKAGLSIWIQCPPARSLLFNLAAKTTSILSLPAGDCRHPWRRPYSVTDDVRHWGAEGARGQNRRPLARCCEAMRLALHTNLQALVAATVMRVGWRELPITLEQFVAGFGLRIF